MGSAKQVLMRCSIGLTIGIGLAGCAAQVEMAADQIAEVNDRAVQEYQEMYCTPTACVENRLACGLPMGAAVRILNAEQLASVQGFVTETAGTCKR